MIAKCDGCNHESICGPDTETACEIRATGVYVGYCWGCDRQGMVFREVSHSDASDDARSWNSLYVPDAGRGLSELGERIVAGDV
jgi:hypothetical protein